MTGFVEPQFHGNISFWYLRTARFSRIAESDADGFPYGQTFRHPRISALIDLGESRHLSRTVARALAQSLETTFLSLLACVVARLPA
jgi:hypothetical protein